MYKLLVAAVCCAMILAFLPVSANADEWNKKTIVTFNAPVELPGIVLPAGTYVFKLMDSLSSRNIVQVFNEDESRIYTTILAIPNYRLTPSDKTVMSFAERPVNAPEAMRAWFYPGDNFGQEFAYPKARARELAEIAKEPVLSAEVTPEETPQEMLKAPVVTVTPEKEEVGITDITVAPPIEPRVAENVEPAPIAEPIAELPKTASPLPLIALLGVTALALSGALKALVRHS